MTQSARTNPGGPDADNIEETITESEQPIYRQQVMTLLSRGYQPSLELAEAAYTMLQLRRIRAVIEDDRTVAERWRTAREARALALQSGDEDAIAVAEVRWKNSQAGGDARETTKQTWQALGDLQQQLRNQITDLDRRQQQLRAGDPEREFRLAEQWVQERLGEFEYRCPAPTCGQMLTIPALPHWAYAQVPTSVGPQWMVWSPELWTLVEDGTIGLSVMAYALRTSPEALKITAERRGEVWPESINLEMEEATLDLRIRALDRAALALNP